MSFARFTKVVFSQKKVVLLYPPPRKQEMSCPQQALILHLLPSREDCCLPLSLQVGNLTEGTPYWNQPRWWLPRETSPPSAAPAYPIRPSEPGHQYWKKAGKNLDNSPKAITSACHQGTVAKAFTIRSISFSLKVNQKWGGVKRRKRGKRRRDC